VEYVAQIDAMRGADSVAGLRVATFAFAQAFGFRRAFFLNPIAKDPRSGRTLTSFGYSDSWARAYRRSLYLVDPLPELALAHAQPMRWGALRDDDRLPEAGRRYLRLIARFGMADGIAIPTYGPGLRCGLMGVGDCPDLDSFSARNLMFLQMGVQVSYARYCELVDVAMESGPPLSNREIDVLYWIAQGKSNAVISVILGISKQTVDTYARRIFAKLDVADRTAAAVAALQRGLFIAGAGRPRREMPAEVRVAG
jgi:LuxR family quorum-sensing system transcriptional regulator CciR